MAKDGPPPALKAFLTVSTSPNSTIEASEFLRLLGHATNDPALVKAADRLAGGAWGGLTPREATKAARDARKNEMLAEVARLEKEGKGYSAVTLVALVFAIHSCDAIEVDSLKRQLRRWRNEKNGHCP